SMGTMFGCWIAAAVSASRRNRSTSCGSLVASRTLIATQRRNPRSQDLNTAPIAPFPIWETRTYFPSTLAGFAAAQAASSGSDASTAAVRLDDDDSGLAHFWQT